MSRTTGVPLTSLGAPGYEILGGSGEPVTDTKPYVGNERGSGGLWYCQAPEGSGLYGVEHVSRKEALTYARMCIGYLSGELNWFTVEERSPVSRFIWDTRWWCWCGANELCTLSEDALLGLIDHAIAAHPDHPVVRG
jgi:hypothetical protein